MTTTRADILARQDIAVEIQDDAILAIAAGVNPKDAIAALKPGLRNLPAGPLYAVAGAFDDGARKYGAFNWRANPVLASVYHDAAKRHIDAWFHGTDRAVDSGKHHLAHAVACLLIVLDAQQQGSLRDDRPPHNVPLDQIIAAMTASAPPAAFYAAKAATVEPMP